MSLTSNYLDHLDGRLEKQGGRSSVARLLLVARIREAAGDPDAVVRYHERVFEEILSEQHAATITGVLIVQKESVIHLVETSMDTSTAFLRQIQSMEAELDPSARVMENVKILVSSEDCPAPYFAKWFHYNVQLNAESNVDIDKEDPVEASWGVYDKLVELASEMRQHSGTSVSELKRKYNHLVPSNERVLGLVETEKNMTLSETIDAKFRSPVPSPWSVVKLWRVGPGLVTLMNMSCVAFMCHYNGVKYYEELEERTERKYAITIGSAMAISFGVFTTMMLFGFRTFGGAAQTLLLNNYHRTDDPLASLARLATGFSILCGFPLMFAALKTSFFNAASEISEKFGDGGMKMARRFQSDEGLRTGCIVSLMAVVTSVACTKSEEDVATIIGLIGAILGSGANYIIPAVFNICLLKRLGANGGILSEISLNKAIIAFGAVFMVMGTVVTLKEAGSHH